MKNKFTYSIFIPSGERKKYSIGIFMSAFDDKNYLKENNLIPFYYSNTLILLVKLVINFLLSALNLINCTVLPNEKFTRLIPILPKNSLIIVHDILSFKKFSSNKNIYFTCISNFTKNELRKLDNTIKILPNTYNLIDFNTDFENKMKLIKPKKNIINFGYVGSLATRKNIAQLIKLSNQKGCKFYFVVSSFYMKMVKTKIPRNITILENLDTRELITFYKEIDCIINLSHYEGCGRSPIEAQYFNKPCIVSKIPAHQEFLENTVQYFNEKINLKDQYKISIQKLKENSDKVKLNLKKHNKINIQKQLINNLNCIRF